LIHYTVALFVERKHAPISETHFWCVVGEGVADLEQCFEDNGVGKEAARTRFDGLVSQSGHSSNGGIESVPWWPCVA
jgi:hypothetical protein